MPTRKSLPAVRKSITHRVEITDPELGSTDFYIIVGLRENGQPGELFIKMGKAGSTLRGLLDVIGIQTSLLLQYGVPLEILADKLTGQRFGPAGATDNPEISHCSSAVDYIFRWMKPLAQKPTSRPKK